MISINAFKQELADTSNNYPESEWTLRLKTLQQIKEHLNEGSTSDLRFIAELMPSLKRQFGDQRSAIVNEVTKVLVSACKIYAH